MKKSKRKSENILSHMKMETKLSKTYGIQKSYWKSKVYSNRGLLQEMRKISNKQPKLSSKGIRKETENKAQIQQKDGNNTDHRGNK